MKKAVYVFLLINLWTLLIFLIIHLFGCGNGGNNKTANVTMKPVINTITIFNDIPDTVNGKIIWHATDLDAYIPTMQNQMHEFASAWGGKYDAKITQVFKASNLPKAFVLSFLPGDSPNGLIGYHDVDDNGNPFANVYAINGLVSRNDPFLEGEHEALEMNFDPSTNGVEVVDPVVCWTYCENWPNTIIEPGVLECGEGTVKNTGFNIVPDFILPAWNVKGSKGPWDFMGLLKGPGTHC